MNFSCEACHHRYAVPDEKIRGRTVRIRCRHCGHLTSVTGPADSAPTTAAPPPAPAQAEWYAMIAGAQAGPFDLPGLAERAREGSVTSDSFVWRPGMADWKRAGELPELTEVLSPPPPVQPQRQAPRTSGFSAAELFSDLGREDEAALPPDPEEPSQPSERRDEERGAEDDPFAALGDIDPAKLPPPGESTMFFIQKAGVTKRNPPWKIAAFIGAGLGSVALVLLLLSSLDVVPLRLRTVDGSGQAVEQSVFSADGVSHLGDVLMGRGASPEDANAATRDDKRRPARPAQKPQGAPAQEAVARVEKPAAGPSKEELAALYGDTARSDRGPRVRPASSEATAQVATAGGLSQEQLAKVVAASQTAFQTCIESELRKNPNLKVPRFFIRANVANSGVVTAASIDRKDVDGSALGECLKSRARRMAFAPFEGEELVVEIPLIVGVAM